MIKLASQLRPFLVFRSLPIVSLAYTSATMSTDPSKYKFNHTMYTHCDYNIEHG